MKVGCYLQQASFAGADDGFKARFERANTDKELPGGRKIDFSACEDDGNNPQNNLQIVTRLTQQDEVFAIVGISADFLQPSADFLARNQVPFFGWGFVPGFCANRWAFGFNGCLVTGYPGAKQKVYQSNLALGPIEAAGLTPETTKVALQAGDDDAGQGRQRHHRRPVQAGGGRRRLQRVEPARARPAGELHAVRAGGEREGPEPPAHAHQLPDRARVHRGDVGEWVHRAPT